MRLQKSQDLKRYNKLRVPSIRSVTKGISAIVGKSHSKELWRAAGRAKKLAYIQVYSKDRVTGES